MLRMVLEESFNWMETLLSNEFEMRLWIHKDCQGEYGMGWSQMGVDHKN